MFAYSAEPLVYPTLQRSWKGGILVSHCPSVRPSVRLWTESCPLCIFNNTRRIHFTSAHFIKQLQKVCHVQSLFQNSSIFNFGKFFKFVTFICLCLLLTWDPIWLNSMKRRRVSSERRRSSCSSLKQWGLSIMKDATAQYLIKILFMYFSSTKCDKFIARMVESRRYEITLLVLKLERRTRPIAQWLLMP